MAHLRLAEFKAFKRGGATILDVRSEALFGDGHAIDSLNIGIASPSFSVWAGSFLNPDFPIILVVECETQAQQAQLELARIGFDQVAGFIAADDLDEKQQIAQIGAREFLTSLESPQGANHLGCAISSRMESGPSGIRDPYFIAAAASPNGWIFQKGALGAPV